MFFLTFGGVRSSLTLGAKAVQRVFSRSSIGTDSGSALVPLLATLL